MWANFISHCDQREQYFTIHEVNYFTFGASRIFHFLLSHITKSRVHMSKGIVTAAAVTLAGAVAGAAIGIIKGMRKKTK